MHRYSVLGKRALLKVNDRVSNNMQGICVRGYATPSSMFHLFFTGAGRHHNKFVRGV